MTKEFEETLQAFLDDYVVATSHKEAHDSIKMIINEVLRGDNPSEVLLPPETFQELLGAIMRPSPTRLYRARCAYAKYLCPNLDGIKHSIPITKEEDE